MNTSLYCGEKTNGNRTENLVLVPHAHTLEPNYGVRIVTQASLFQP